MKWAVKRGAMVSGTDNIEYIVQVWQEGRTYVAHAMPLDVMSAGQTLEEARRALDEAVQLFLKTAAEAGTLSDVLQEAGYEYRSGHWESPAWVGIERHFASVGA